MHNEDLRGSNNSYGWDVVAPDPPSTPTVVNPPPTVPATGIEIRQHR